MPINKVAAAYLAYFAYIDDGQDTVHAKHFRQYLGEIPGGPAKGPWTLCWGPGVNNGTLAYVARGVDGTYGLAFRGTDVDGSLSTAFLNVLEDADGLAVVPWLYPQQPGLPVQSQMQISAGIDQALSFVTAMTDPKSDLSLLDFLRGLAKSGPLDLMVVGHSLGAALAVVATAWLQDQLPKVEPLKFKLWPHTFAAPTMWNGPFATMFGPAFPYYALVNQYDVVPMGWANLSGAAATYPVPYPNLYNDYYYTLYFAINFVNGLIQQYGFTQITPSNPDSFSGKLISTDSWPDEAGAMHSMQYQYFPYATGTVAPCLPGITRTGGVRARSVSPD
jgi:Lipase (class 3)